MNNLELQITANEIRKGIVTAVHSAKSGHPGGSLSAADIFTYLYFEEMKVDPKNPKWQDRDRFVLSKGHVAPGYYATLAEKGFFHFASKYIAFTSVAIKSLSLSNFLGNKSLILPSVFWEFLLLLPIILSVLFLEE